MSDEVIRAEVSVGDTVSWKRKRTQVRAWGLVEKVTGEGVEVRVGSERDSAYRWRGVIPWPNLTAHFKGRAEYDRRLYR